MTATTLNCALERMGFNGKGSMVFSAHGFRVTASTILNEMVYRPDVIEGYFIDGIGEMDAGCTDIDSVHVHRQRFYIFKLVISQAA